MSLIRLIRSVFRDDTLPHDVHKAPCDPGRSPFSPGPPHVYDPHTQIGSPPPSAPGIYSVLDRNNTRLYIGETNNVERRIREHVRTGNILPGERVAYKIANNASSSATRRSVETQKIQRHKPLRNKRGGGGGRMSQ